MNLQQRVLFKVLFELLLRMQYPQYEENTRQTTQLQNFFLSLVKIWKSIFSA
jgi:hypothetical protein